MVLTPINQFNLPVIIERFNDWLGDRGVSANAFKKIEQTHRNYNDAVDTPLDHQKAVSLNCGWGIPTIDRAPAEAYSWDGRAVSTRTEASVLIHEVAHWLVAPSNRRTLPDFGLGAGPETGWVVKANAVRCVDDVTKEREELYASLLGILYEAALGLPAIHSFIEQNWFEGWGRAAAVAQFDEVVRGLFSAGHIDETGLPIFPPGLNCRHSSNFDQKLGPSQS